MKLTASTMAITSTSRKWLRAMRKKKERGNRRVEIQLVEGRYGYLPTPSRYSLGQNDGHVRKNYFGLCVDGLKISVCKSGSEIANGLQRGAQAVY